jgi:predicted deacylase
VTKTENPYAVDIKAPNISAYKAGNTGIDYITTFDSGRPGPHVMVSAIVHGNELCGPVTLDFLFKNNIRPTKGKLTLGFLNVAAFENFNAEMPETSRWVDEDFNRVWGTDVLDGPRDSVELRRAREIRPIIDDVDFLLDLHSMQHPTAPLMLAGPSLKARTLARELGYPAHVMCDQGHAAGKRLRDYGAFADESSPKNALLIECGQHWEKKSIDVAREATLRFLLRFETIDPAIAAAHLSADPLAEQKVIDVAGPITIETDKFRFAEPYLGLEVIEKAGTVIAWDGEAEISTPFDNCVLVMPSRRLMPGQTAVRLGRFID